jgi:hypothetical protein
MDLIEQGQDYNKYQLNEFQQQLVIAPNLNYLAGGEWLPTDLNWEVSPHPSADYQMVKAPFKVYAVAAYGADKQVRFAKGSHYVDFTALPIYYRSSAGALSLVSQPRGAVATVQGDTIIWDSPYGGNTSLEWTITAQGMNKYFNVASKSVFPNPPVGFRQNSTLEIPFRLDFSMDITPRLLSGLWDLLSDTASDVIDFEQSGAKRFGFKRPYFTDANGTVYWGTYRLRRSLTDLIVSSSFKIADLNSAVYPIRIDPSISQEIVDSNATVGISNSTNSGSFSITNNTIGTLTGGGTVNSQVAWTFLNVQLPQYAEITAAALNTFFSSKNGTTTTDARFTAEDTANSSLITSFSDFFARVRTAARVVIPINTTLYAAGAAITVDVTAFVQAIVSKSGWASGNAISFFAQDDSESLTTASRVTFRNEQWSAAFRNYLTVTYNNPPPAPLAPTNVTAAASPNPIKISVNWTKATYATQHRIYRNGVLLTTVGDVSTYADTTVVKGTTYNYAVESVDQYGRIGGKSANTSNITVDNTAPTMNARVRGR